jgi:hypothetical protein
MRRIYVKRTSCLMRPIETSVGGDFIEGVVDLFCGYA